VHKETLVLKVILERKVLKAILERKVQQEPKVQKVLKVQ
jgi:hypothetical protein